jgi:hypothetical protein
MYRRPKFLEVLLEIRQEMALEADYDVDLFAEIARTGNRSARSKRRRALPEAAPETPQPKKTANPRRRTIKK